MIDLRKASDLMEEGVKTNVFPGGVLLVSEDGQVHLHRAFGYTDLQTRDMVSLDTVFDIASLTKPLGTTLAIIRLVQAGKLDIEDRLDKILPEFSETSTRAVSIKNLLRHDSGLPAHQPYFEKLRDIPWEFHENQSDNPRKKALREFLITEPLENPVGEKTVYSDIGFMILEWVVEKLSGMGLDEFLVQEVYRPLGVDLFFMGLNQKKPDLQFAATEDCPWRKKVLRGEVHDDNTWAVGGVCGQAGLFGTAGAVHDLLLEIVKAWHGSVESKSELFDSALVRRFLHESGNTGRTLGFDMPSKENSSSGRFFAPESIGHLGFTGTSFWIDLKRKLIAVLLTNRVHPARSNIMIRAFRPILHDAVAKQ